LIVDDDGDDDEDEDEEVLGGRGILHLVSGRVGGGMKALVTGGGGFLGKAIVSRLVNRAWQVRTLNRGSYPELSAMGVEEIRGDLAEREAVERAVARCDVVFHVAAKAAMWGAYEEFFNTNVLGTRHIVSACRQHGVPRLVYTSTPSVVHSGRDIEGADESLPYARRYHAHYPRTKAEAERAVLAANSSELATVALRPHLIWGPEDSHLVPQIVARAREGTLRFVGDGSNRVDSVFVDNAADAHLLACDRLAPGAPCAGRAYFISNGEPLPISELVNRILAAAGLPPVRRSVPVWLAYGAGAAMEAAYGLLRLPGEPRMTRMIARHLATAHWYDISAARRDLGYRPAVTIEQGLARLEEWLAGDGRLQE
jgi:nucleoside-diphosphate-sugar epimerase